MAEYKYRALGWKDDDIASLNVVDGTADNQVELQITKQGAGGTINGPAIIGKDGITIDKAADSEKIEISGKGCVQHYSGPKGYRRAYITDETNLDTNMIIKQEGDNASNSLIQRKEDGSGEIVMPETPVDLSITNKKYVDDNFVKKDTSVANQQVYGHSANGDPQMFYVTTGNSNPDWLCKYQPSISGAAEPTGSGRLITQDPTQPYQAANKHYVDEADKLLRLKLSNLEQALNGYILDTTEEAYADLDSAVLKNSVAVGDNVYPIADKTRALVSRIEGKTTKMVQLLDKSKFPATSTPTAGVTVTKTDDGGLHVLGTAASSGGMTSWGITVNVEKGHKYLSLLKGNNKITTPFVTLKSDTSQYVSFVADIATSTIEGECNYGFNVTEGDYDETIYPNLFDLTAMNREDITSVEQFKAEFPEFYPYENGNIYPAKISGVKFTGKNLFNPSTPKYSGESGIELDGNNIIVRQLRIGRYLSANFELPNAKFLIGKKISISAKVKTSDNNRGLIRVLWMREGVPVYASGMDIISQTCTGETERNLSASGIVLAPSDDAAKLCLLLYSNADGDLSETKTYTATYSNIQVEISDAPTAYEPYTEPVSVTLPETYDLHGIGDYKDYLEITKNEGNELYTLKKIQAIDKHVFDGTEAWGVSGRELPICKVFLTGAVSCLYVYSGKGGLSNHLPLGVWTDDTEHIQFGQANSAIYVFLNKEKFTTGSDVQEYLAAQYASGNPLIAYYILPTPVETVIATNLTYEQVTAVRHNGGLIEVEGNTNKGYARPTVTNTIVYRLTAANTTEG